jgi:ankyrin repeat protein
MDLYEAARQGNIDGIESAIEKGCDVNALDKYGKPPLWFAVQNGHSDTCRILLARGACVEGKDLAFSSSQSKESIPRLSNCCGATAKWKNNIAA